MQRPTIIPRSKHEPPKVPRHSWYRRSYLQRNLHLAIFRQNRCQRARDWPRWNTFYEGRSCSRSSGWKWTTYTCIAITSEEKDQDYIHIDGTSKYQAITIPNCPPSSNTIGSRDAWYQDLDQDGRIYARLMDIYIFAAIYDAPRLRRDVTVIWQRFSLLCNTLPPLEVIKQAYTHNKDDLPLLQYIILWYGYINKDVPFKATDWAVTSPRFLAGVLEIMYKKQSTGHQFSGLHQNW